MSTEYLMEMGFVEDRAEEVASCVGGRLVYLQSCLKLTDNILSNDICYNIKKALFSRMLGAQAILISKGKPESIILDKLCKW